MITNARTAKEVTRLGSEAQQSADVEGGCACRREEVYRAPPSLTVGRGPLCSLV